MPVYVCVCVYVLFSGWSSGKPDIFTAIAMLPVLIYNFVEGVGGSCVMALDVLKRNFMSNPPDFLSKSS